MINKQRERASCEPIEATARVVESRLVEVNEAVCDKLALHLQTAPIPDAREEISLEGFTRVERAQLLFCVVAICHQTSVAGRPPLEGIIGGRRVRGWDYLLQKFTEAARLDRAKLKASYWATINATDLQRIFRNSKGEDLLLNLEHRAELIRDLGRLMKLKGWHCIQQLHDECEGRISCGRPNLLEGLSKFIAYRDPVRKKSFFLLSLMRNSATWTYRDPENLGAPVDYHEVRGHLRLGTVTVKDEALRSKLLRQQAVSEGEDVAIRTAVLDAIMRLSELTGLHDPERLHYMFWNVFRNYCTREEPNCYGYRHEAYLPERYASLAVVKGDRRACPFSDICHSAGAEDPYLEHMVDTDFY